MFRRDLDRWGTHNVVHVDGVNNVTPRTSWHQEHKVVHEDPQFKGKYTWTDLTYMPNKSQFKTMKDQRMSYHFGGSPILPHINWI